MSAVYEKLVAKMARVTDIPAAEIRVIYERRARLEHARAETIIRADLQQFRSQTPRRQANAIASVPKVAANYDRYLGAFKELRRRIRHDDRKERTHV